MMTLDDDIKVDGEDDVNDDDDDDNERKCFKVFLIFLKSSMKH